MELHERVEVFEQKFPALENAVDQLIERMIEVDTMLATLHGVQKILKEVVFERYPDAQQLIVPAGSLRTPGKSGVEAVPGSGPEGLCP